MIKNNALFSSKRFASTLLAATALALVSAPAWADGNFANVSQSGSDNTSIVAQGSGDDNELGTASDAASQAGAGNSLDVEQTGSRNQVGTRGSGLDQTGNGNGLAIDQLSDGNRVNQINQGSGTGAGTLNSATVTQQTASGEPADGRSTVTNIAQTHDLGAANAVAITQTSEGAGGNIIGTGTADAVSGGVTQTGGGNDADLRQTGEANRIGTSLQTGQANTTAISQDGIANTIDASQVGDGNIADASQAGNGNGNAGFGSFVATRSSLTQGLIRQEGDGNTLQLDIFGNDNQSGIDQSGDYNEAVARATGDANEIAIGQSGNANLGEIAIGDRSFGSDGNLAVLNQDATAGFGNEAAILVDGDDNQVSVDQVSSASFNEASVDIQGDANDVAVDQDGANVGEVFVVGNANTATLDQNGLVNSALIEIYGSDNAFDVDQDGTYNEATTRATGDGNAVTASQVGGTNIAEILIGDRNGGSNDNVVGLSQDSGLTFGNHAELLIDGNANVIAANQLGVTGGDYGNTLLVDVYGDQNGVTVDQLGRNHGTVLVSGDLNIASLDQDGSDNTGQIEILGNGNQLTLTQSGTMNDALALATGNDNAARIDQSGVFNTALLTIEGNSNGVGALSGAAGTLVATSGGLLVAGAAIQDSTSALSGNSLSYEVVGNMNRFAFAQIGGNNSISGLVGDAGASNGNQAAVLQNGSNNVTSFSQNGGGSNTLSVSQ